MSNIVHYSEINDLIFVIFLGNRMDKILRKRSRTITLSQHQKADDVKKRMIAVEYKVGIATANVILKLFRITSYLSSKSNGKGCCKSENVFSVRRLIY